MGNEIDALRIENAHLREAFGLMEKAYNLNEREVEIARASRQQALLCVEDLKRQLKEYEAEVARLRQRLEDVNIKDAAKTAEINILTAENRKLCERKAWYGDYLDLRSRYAEAVQNAYREGFGKGWGQGWDHGDLARPCDAAWLQSEARGRLT